MNKFMSVLNAWPVPLAALITAAMIVSSASSNSVVLPTWLIGVFNFTASPSEPDVVPRPPDTTAGSQLERDKAVRAEKLANQVEPNGSWEEKLEPALAFLASPWKLWETGNVTLRRAVLKLAFRDRIRYCRNEGARTPEIALPFKALGVFEGKGVCFGAGGGT